MRDRSLAILTIAFLIFICVGLAAAYAFSGNSDMKVFDDRNNTQTVTVKNGETFKIELIENPTTGYSWNISTTPGLTIINDTFIPPSGDVMGAAGMHEWQVKATGTGDQQFTGVYKRPWEPSFGNESVYSLNVKIA